MKRGKSTGSAWMRELAEVLAEITGNRPSVRRTEWDEDEADADMLWWRCAGSPSICVGIGEADAAKLLGLRTQSLPGEPANPARASFAELMDRSSPADAKGRGEIVARKPGGLDNQEAFQVEFPSGESLLFVVAKPELAPPGNSNLDMLMDIELPLTIRFGSRQMALRDITGLSAGSIIEFERGVDEPVEVLINGHVVALGEAVTVHGSYGIRISEISSRRERLKSSFAASQDDPERPEELFA